DSNDVEAILRHQHASEVFRDLENILQVEVSGVARGCTHCNDRNICFEYGLAVIGGSGYSALVVLLTYDVVDVFLDDGGKARVDLIDLCLANVDPDYRVTIAGKAAKAYASYVS